MSDASSQQVQTETRRRMPRWAWLVLIASLAANLFVVGAVARAFWPHRYATANAGSGGLFGNLVAYTRQLPDDRRVTVRQQLAKERPFATLRPLREEVRNARREAVRLFRSDPFDRAGFLAAEAQAQAADAKLRQAIARLAADVAGAMTAQERVGFLQWRELRRGGMRAQGTEPDGDGPPDGKRTP